MQGRKKERNNEKRKRKAMNRQIQDNLWWVLPVASGGLLLIFGITYFYATRPIPPLPESVHDSFTKLD